MFIPFVLPGEEVEASPFEEKPGFVRARLERVLTPSPRRVAAKCPYFLRCGGCHYQHTDYEYQLEIKADILKENLRRIAKLELVHELKIHASSPWNYRNRTRMKLQAVPEFAIGYYELNSHDLLPVEECPISSPLINRAIAGCWQLGKAGQIGNEIQEIEFFANAADTELLVALYGGDGLHATTVEKTAEHLKNALPQVAGVAVFRGRERGGVEPEMLATVGEGALTYETAHAAYRVSAGTFFQVNRYLIDELADIVTAGQSGGTALDLYSGVSLFSTVLARNFQRVIAVEASPTSHADLRYNSPANVKAVRAMAEQYLKNVSGKLQPDLVVVDPPRNGLGESVIHSLVTLGAPRVTYVSCDPATLSRDLGRLLKAGYRVQQAHLVDLFPQTYHLESVFHLVR